ncbi:MAG: hypothetical protein R3C01_01440 [Planctomycetaceae bacterium]
MVTRIGWIGLLLASLVAVEEVQAQQVTIGVPQQNISTGFSEQIGGSWSVNGPGFFARMGGPRPVGFGNFNPNAGFTTGFGIGNGNRFSQFNFQAGQGSYQTYTSTTPLLTVTNGMPGSLFIGSVSPYVIGFTPVGNGAFMPVFNNNFVPLTSNSQNFQNFGAANSIDGRILRGELQLPDNNRRANVGLDPRHFANPDIQAAAQARVKAQLPELPLDAPPASVVTVRSSGPADAVVQADKARDLFEKGKKLEAEGKTAAARLLYNMALPQADPNLRKEINTHLNR